MYTTCLHCHSSLGQNEAIEHFQVGRRLAFDAAKGRLWVVCGKCRRWNLTPLEERWEAIEECERSFSLTRTRVASDNIALARVPSGVDLIRVGAPNFSEFAAWRYGASLHHRWKTRALPFTFLASSGYGLQLASNASLIAFGPAMLALSVLIGVVLVTDWRRGIVKVRLPDGRVVSVTHSKGNEVQLAPDASYGWALKLSGKADIAATGATATHGLRGVLTAANFFVGRKHDIAEATTLLGNAPGPGRFLAEVASASARHRIANIGALPPEVRLALEMALHEDTERAALDGELQRLEGEWQMAEEVAAIADNLLTPRGIVDALVRIKTGISRA